ncbi:MAG: molybdopterin cofactor-binding domain-containing protein, partial [Thermodesulfobacteriota bacterium]|nr:molybdopterin cofactor-binding domain-containing protein [Thermodesulfobacteriota bacterium]
MNEEYAVIGKSAPLVDAKVKITGSAKYASDMTMSGMLYGKILRSPYPHAKILNIDTSKAKALHGVKAVITGNDTAKVKYGIIEKAPWTMNECILTFDKARYIGDELAAVAAISEDIAEEALDLIEVEYEELPGVFDPEEAMEPDAPKIHEDRRGNISARAFWEIGKVDEVLKEAYYVAEDKFQTHLVIHAPMEPHVTLANFDSSGKLTVWSSTQVPYYLKRGLARTLVMPEGKIRVIKPHVGGGFGGKWEMLALDFCASLLSIKTGLPVKIAYTREEEFIGTHRKHPQIMWLKTGVTKDGKILVRDSRIILDGGAYNSCGPITTHLSGLFQAMPYKTPAFRYEGLRVFTNKAPCGAMRGHGGTQPHMAMDVQLDKIAEEIGIDPVELRLKNSLESGETTIVGYTAQSCGLKECLEKGAEAFSWKEKRGKLKKENRGIGIGSNGFISGEQVHLTISPEAYSAATIKLIEDGTAILFTGASDIGQGSNTTLSMIAAEEMGVTLEDIKIVSADTDLTPVDMGSYSSRVTLFAGNAVKAAAKEIKEKLLNVAADKLEANVLDLEAKNRKIYVKGSPEKGIGIPEVISITQKLQDGKPLVATGIYTPSGINLEEASKEVSKEGFIKYMAKTPLSPTASFGAHFAEVKIDRETGKLNILRFLATHDCGFAINPMAVEGQLEGSVHMGLGYVLSEEMVLDKGLVLNPSFLNYRILTSMDMPHVETITVEPVDPQGPFGAKEA